MIYIHREISSCTNKLLLSRDCSRDSAFATSGENYHIRFTEYNLKQVMTVKSGKFLLPFTAKTVANVIDRNAHTSRDVKRTSINQYQRRRLPAAATTNITVMVKASKRVTGRSSTCLPSVDVERCYTVIMDLNRPTDGTINF